MVRCVERVLVCIVLFLSNPLFAQEWSAEQKEVVAYEVAYWKGVCDRDQEGTLALMHDEYKSWGYGNIAPSGKAAVKSSFSHDFPATKCFYHEVRPLAVVVRGSTAVVHYVVSYHGSNEKGEHESGDLRWTDTLVKEGGKWLLLGDHGGSASELGNN